MAMMVSSGTMSHHSRPQDGLSGTKPIMQPRRGSLMGFAAAQSILHAPPHGGERIEICPHHGDVM